MVLATEAGFAGISVLLAVNAALPSPALGVIFGLAALQAGLFALQRPSLDALLPRLVSPDELTAAGALRAAAGTVGRLLGPLAAGGALALATSGWTSRVRRQGWGLVLAAASWGIGITLFGLATSLPLALLCLAIAGAADAVSGVFRMAIWNRSVPDALRGRLAS